MINKVLFDRERRYNEILGLIEQYKLPVLCGKINYPGYDKNTCEVKKAFLILEDLLNNSYESKSVFSKSTSGFDGPALLMVLNINEIEAKKVAVSIEDNNKIGRVFDIDIYGKDGASIGRNEIGLKSRACIICGEDGRVCTKSEKHDRYEVIEVINKIINEHGE